MKRIIGSGLAAIMALGIFAGCQATPEEPIVIGKNNETMMEKSQTGDGIFISDMELPSQRYVYEDVAANGNLSIQVDADIKIPEVSALPIYSVTMDTFSQEQADKIMEVLLKGNPLYKQQLSSSAIESKKEKLEILKEQKANGNDNTEYADGHSIDTAIAQLEAEIALAEDQSEKQLAPTTFQHDDTYNIDEIVGIAAVGGREYYLNIKNWTEGENQIYVSFLGDHIGSISNYTDDDSVSVGISNEQAETQASELLAQMGVSGMAQVACCAAKDGDKTAWHLIFAREFDGVPTTYTNEDVYIAEESAPWGYERIEMLIDARGLLAFEWRNPYTDITKLEDDCKILTFDQMTDVFKKMIVVDNAFYQDSKVEINISEIKLGMMRIKEQDSQDSGFIVPVWDFFGTFSQSIDGSPAAPMNDKFSSFLTINAIDGTIIDRSKGY